MDADQFWSIVERSREAAKRDWRPRRSVLDLQQQHLAGAMRALTPFEMIVFRQWWGRFSSHVFRHDVRGAVYWACSCASEDFFADARDGLVALGRQAVVSVREDADNLVDVIERWDVDVLSTEGIAAIPLDVYEQRTGVAEVPELAFSEARAAVDRQPDGLPRLACPPEDKFDFTDPAVMRARFPRLTKKLPEPGGFV